MKPITGHRVTAPSYHGPELTGMNVKNIAEAMTRYCPSTLNINTVLIPNGIVYRAYENVTEGVKYEGMETKLSAGWFEVSKMMNMGINTAILMWTPTFMPWTTMEDRTREYAMVKNVLLHMGWSIQLTRLSGSDIQLFAVDKHHVHRSILDALGVKTDPKMAPGKKLKRLGIFSVSTGAFAYWGENRVGDYFFDVEIEEDHPEADGSMQISLGFAKRLCDATNIPFTDHITRLQLWIATTIGLIKGMAYIKRDGAMNTDIRLPRESLDDQFRMDFATVGKVVPHEVQHGAPTSKPMDGLLRMPELVKHVNIEELGQFQFEFVEQQDNREIALALASDEWLEMATIEREDGDNNISANTRYIEKKIHRRVYEEAAKDLLAANGNSLFIAPEIMRQATGRVYRSLAAKQERWHSKDGAMPGMYVSALRGYWTDPTYASIEQPDEGFVKILWVGDTVDGFCLNPHDMLSPNVRYRSDGGDLDDLLDGVLMQDKYNNQLIWLIRNPTSWGGGFFLKVDNQDWEHAIEAGYRVYDAKGAYEVPQLAHIMMDPNSEVGLKVKQHGGK